MKLVVTNYHFPPDPSVGGLRWAGFTKYLARVGARVDVVTSGGRDGTEQTPEGVVVHHRSRRRTLNDVYQDRAVRRASGSRSAAGSAGAGEVGAGRGLLRTLRGELSAALAFPDYSRGWMLRARAVIRSIVREGGTTAVISSGPPHTTHMAAGPVARRAGVPHIVDLRDPWATHRYDEEIWRGIHTRHIGRLLLPLLERRAFTGADAVIANTRRLRDLLLDAYPGLRVVWIPNGVDPEELERGDDVEPFPGLSIAYTGTLYGGRYLDEVMEGFRAFLESTPEARDAGSKIRVAGNMDGPHRDHFLESRRRLGLEDAVEHLGRVPRERAMELTLASSLATVLAQQQELQVPAKLYELVGLRRPTLVVAERDSASADEAARFGLPLTSPGSAGELPELFRRLWEGAGPVPPKNPPRLSHDDLAREVEALVRDIGDGQ